MGATSGSYFYQSATTAGKASTARWNDERFIPVASEQNAQIHLDKRSFSASGKVTTVSNYDIPILNKDQQSIKFEPGKSYRVTSNLTRSNSDGITITDPNNGNSGTGSLQ
jgi:hypothetical protein